MISDRALMYFSHQIALNASIVEAASADENAKVEDIVRVAKKIELTWKYSFRDPQCIEQCSAEIGKSSDSPRHVVEVGNKFLFGVVSVKDRTERA